MIIYGVITQFDAATGKCFLRASVGASPQESSFGYSQNSMASSGDGETTCPVFDPLVQDDEVKLWVTLDGSYSYDTQIGGNTTVPLFTVWQAELLPAAD